nr:MAG TPA: hypothetical protein [Caudoviricetes sp.]
MYNLCHSYLFLFANIQNSYYIRYFKYIIFY